MTNPALYRDVARVALSVARQHGFALGGGVAWVFTGLVDRPTQDVDLFSSIERAPAAAAEAVRAALLSEGFNVTDSDAGSELGEVFYGFNLDQKEWLVTRDGEAVRLSMCRLDYHHKPVIMDVGPVMHTDDLVGSKAAALTNRREVRDYIDIAAAMRAGYTISNILRLAHKHDPGLEAEDIVTVGRYLDGLDDRRFAPFRMNSTQVHELRELFSKWPRG
ncbi:nucleotidyl transferase AbiEii/AbiGii toxin family protein [Salinispora arenicola]|uniref:nucleotidyl transferase AbiEii/AbiGii toxin family protein n=1 Tax=Salinispora arenicola TaxID=168697 RepID=UPI0003622008|nr:nucleotidyl transferase AbiEii/AbiGii toxin family protein [Salinispora arenicola]